MNYIVGKKEKMMQIFDESGATYPVTPIAVSKNVVTQLKTEEKDGYVATQIGIDEVEEKRANKAQIGHAKDAGTFKMYKEVRDMTDKEVGAELTADQFTEGEKVQVTGISKGKGFQGVVKRHGFAGGRRSHGQKHSEREPGSIGSTGPQRVFKGVRMAGRMGSDRVTVKNLKVIKVDTDLNKIYIGGAVPGVPGGYVEIKQK